MKQALAYLALLSSFGTLICCAIPALLVTLGMGATLAATVSAVPQLIWLSKNKALIFGVAGGLLLASAVLQYRARALPCPVDPVLRDACLRGRKYSKLILLFSGLLYSMGVLFAYGLPLIGELMVYLELVSG